LTLLSIIKKSFKKENMFEQCDVICHVTVAFYIYHVIVGSLTLYIWYTTGCALTSAITFICSTIHKNIKKVEEIPKIAYKLRLCHARQETGALTLYIWYINRCALTSATTNKCLTIHKNIKKVEEIPKIAYKWLFVTHVTKLIH
jgi:hypothetical protein